MHLPLHYPPNQLISCLPKAKTDGLWKPVDLVCNASGKAAPDAFLLYLLLAQ